MSHCPSFEVNVLTAIFYRKGGRNSELIKAFNDFPNEVKSIFFTLTILASQEKPALLSFLNENNWALVTTERLIWCNDQAIDEIAHQDVEDVTIDLLALRRIGGHFKKETKDLKIITKHRGECTIKLAESGAVFFAFLNAVQWIYHRQK
jgi:hypothetical protein